MAIHLVYAKGYRTHAPHVITWELTRRLRPRYEVVVHDLLEHGTIVPRPGDVLLGHPQPDPDTIFQRSFRQSGWAKRIVMTPFSHAMPDLCGWMDDLVTQADAYLAICGRYWTATLGASRFAHWAPKLRRLDLAVNPAHFPPIKQNFNPPGRRRFLYIGYVGPAKGTDYLCALADGNPDLHFAWIGGGTMPSQRVHTLGSHDFNLREAQELVATFDFVIATGRSDANPTTLLEGLSWGLAPVCTPQSGYVDEPWLTNIPLDDVAGASAILRQLNEAPEAELAGRVAAGRAALQRHYTWERFAADVEAALTVGG